MENTHTPVQLAGKPHALSMFRPLLFLPPGAAVYICLALRSGGWDKLIPAAAGMAALVLTGAALAVSVGRRTVCRWHIEDGVLHFTRGLSQRRELTFRLDRLLYAEMTVNPVYSLFGGARVRLYSSVRRRAFFSMLLPKAQAAELVNRIAAGSVSGDGVKPKHMRSGRYSALLGCATSRGTLLPLGAAMIFCLFGAVFRSAEMNIIAAALWLYALLHFLARLAAESHMSVCIMNNGFAVQTGIGGGRRLFVPHSAVVGVIERRNPIAALSGAARFELICEGGRRIPCMRWYEGGSGEEAAKRLLHYAGMSCTRAADGSAFRRLYVRQITAALFGAVLVWLAALPLEREVRVFGMALTVTALTAAVVHCLMAVRCGGECGIRISAGTLRISGMGLLSAEYLTIRRGCLSAVRIQQGICGRIGGQCTAEFIPKGSRRGVKCRCIPYDKMLAITERFY